MNRLLEIILLKKIKGLGIVKINRDFMPLLMSGISFDELVRILKSEGYEVSEYVIESARNEVTGICSDAQIKTLTRLENYHEKFLRLGNNKPAIVYYEGNVSLLDRNIVSVIGTRKPCDNTLKAGAKYVDQLLDREGIVIASGFAQGCDMLAHRKCIDRHCPTIAALSHGLCYKTDKNCEIMKEKILENNGCIISTYEPECAPSKYTFVERDSILAAVSDMVLVLECDTSSGTMHTVKAADKMLISLGCLAGPEFCFSGNNEVINKYNAVPICSGDELIKWACGEIVSPGQLRLSL